MSRIKTTVLFITLCLFFVWQAGVWPRTTRLNAFQGLEGNLDIAGGTAHIPVMKDAAEQIMQAIPRFASPWPAAAPAWGSRKWAKGW